MLLHARTEAATQEVAAEGAKQETLKERRKTIHFEHREQRGIHAAVVVSKRLAADDPKGCSDGATPA